MATVIPVLKRLHSPDVPDLDSFYPDDEQCFGFLLQAFFGPSGGDGEESFDIIVCTPRWLAREVERTGIMTGRHHLFVMEYSLGRIRAFLMRYAQACTGETWAEAASKLSRLGHWEFEDYTP